MERETINYRGKNYHRYPESERPQHRNYFYRHDKYKESPVALHRQIYEDTHGPIPPKKVIHHKDENFLNNTIDNLECITQAEHLKKHPMSEEACKQRACESRERNPLGTWRANNSELAAKHAFENGSKSKGISNWRKENPELAKRIYSEAAKKSVEARRKKRDSLQYNGGGLP